MTLIFNSHIEGEVTAVPNSRKHFTSKQTKELSRVGASLWGGFIGAGVYRGNLCEVYPVKGDKAKRDRIIRVFSAGEKPRADTTPRRGRKKAILHLFMKEGSSG